MGAVLSLFYIYIYIKGGILKQQSFSKPSLFASQKTRYMIWESSESGDSSDKVILVISHFNNFNKYDNENYESDLS